jgi:membrane protease YdiL (CAAX protease family)
LGSPAEREPRAADALVVLALAGASWLAISAAPSADLPVVVPHTLLALLFLGSVAGGAWLRRLPPAAFLAPGRLDAGTAFWTLAGTAGLSATLLGLSEPLLDLFRALGRDYRPDLDRLEGWVRELPAAAAWPLLAGLAPLGEEAVFRGAALRGWRNSAGPLPALLLSSALFAAIHQLPPRIVMTFILGLWFSGLALRSGGLAAPLLAHAANNALVLALMHFRVAEIPAPAAAAGSVLAGIAAWRLFGRRAGPVQGSDPEPPS